MRRCGGTGREGGGGEGGYVSWLGSAIEQRVQILSLHRDWRARRPTASVNLFFFRLGGLMWLTAISRTLDFVCSARVGSAHLCLFTLTLGRPIWALPLLILVCQPEAGWIVIYEIFVSRKNGVVGIYAFGYRCHYCFKFLSEVFWFSKVAVYRTFSLVLNAEHFR